jgi:hypothetical protein
MNYPLKRYLILVLTLVYMIFACSYVLFCHRNTGIINLPDYFKSNSSKQKITITPVIKSSSTNHSPFSHTYLSRPRVISNRVALINFSLIIITLLFLFTFFNLKNLSFSFLRYKYSSHQHTDIRFYQCWRI